MANEDKATRYQRRWRGAVVLRGVASGLVLLVLGMSPLGAALGEWALDVGKGVSAIAVGAFAAAAAAMVAVVRLPFTSYVERTLTSHDSDAVPLWRWAGRAVRITILDLLEAIGGALLLSVLIQWSPERWWLAAAAVAVVLLWGGAHLVPRVVLPRVSTLLPLPPAPLRDRLVALADRMGAGPIGVYEWRLGGTPPSARASVTGLGTSGRVLVSDGLLADHADDEIEVVVAHELAHHVHGDLWASLVLNGVVILVACAAANELVARTLAVPVPHAKSDLLALPWLALGVWATWLAATPVRYALSRAQERRADRRALDATGNASGFMRVVTRLAARHRVEEHMSGLAVVLFSPHPSTTSRVANARAWVTEHARQARAD